MERVCLLINACNSSSVKTCSCSSSPLINLTVISLMNGNNLLSVALSSVKDNVAFSVPISLVTLICASPSVVNGTAVSLILANV